MLNAFLEIFGGVLQYELNFWPLGLGNSLFFLPSITDSGIKIMFLKSDWSIIGYTGF